jgi:hypothetical protein
LIIDNAVKSMLSRKHAKSAKKLSLNIIAVVINMFRINTVLPVVMPGLIRHPEIASEHPGLSWKPKKHGSRRKAPAFRRRYAMADRSPE